jgi:EAL domain-containing protein (putative c-di-GMP-specific phosphodiesterase class I)
VETVEQLAALNEIGCDKAQGYLIARPLPPDVAVSWVRANGADWRATRVSPVRS